VETLDELGAQEVSEGRDVAGDGSDQLVRDRAVTTRNEDAGLAAQHDGVELVEHSILLKEKCGE
jgi:hypothetical protein